jgi:hypothetical protein
LPAAELYFTKDSRRRPLQRHPSAWYEATRFGIAGILESALVKALNLITKSDIRGWFSHCGYSVASD